MKVVVTEFMDEAALAAFGSNYEVIYDPELVDDRPRLLDVTSDADAIIVRNRTQVDRELLDNVPKLACVGRLGVGLDNIDLDACTAKNIAVCPASGANTLSVAEYVIAAALMLVRGAFHHNEAMLAGEWPRNQLIGGEISGRVMGLYGLGEIARAVAERACALGMRIAAHDPFVADDDPIWVSVKRCSADELLQTADVLSLHVPATAQTQGLINAQSLELMKPSAVLINTARGTVVDPASLANALRQGKLAGAALDVFDAEPLSQEAAKMFDNLTNVILTPHIAGVTREGNIRVSDVTVRNVMKELSKRYG